MCALFDTLSIAVAIGTEPKSVLVLAASIQMTFVAIYLFIWANFLGTSLINVRFVFQLKEKTAVKL